MPSSLSNIAAKDGASATIVGGVLAVDKSGAGTGPFISANTLVDNQGVNTLSIKAVSTAPVTATDNAMVTVLRPDSPGIITTGTAGTPSAVVLSVQGVTSMTALQAALVPQTTGGLTISSTLIAAGTNATSVKASAGQLYKVEITNNSANIAYLKIYNTASAPTAGAGTPVIRLMVPGNASGAGTLSTYDNGIAFATGIGFTFTGGIADADTTSVAASAFIVNLYYK